MGYTAKLHDVNYVGFHGFPTPEITFLFLVMKAFSPSLDLLL